MTLLTAGLYLVSLAISTADATPGTDTPEAGVERLMADVSSKPPGPAENDVTCQAAVMYERGKKFRADMKDNRSLRQIIVATYNICTLEGPLAVLYAEGRAAICCSPAKLTPDEFAECKTEVSHSESVTSGQKVTSTEQGNPASFGEDGVFTTFVGSSVPDNREVVATFCLIQQAGMWKVHGLYFSKQPLGGDNKDFVIRQLTAVAQKP